MTAFNPGDTYYIDGRAFVLEQWTPAQYPKKGSFAGRFIYAAGTGSQKLHTFQLGGPKWPERLTEQDLYTRYIPQHDQRLALNYTLPTRYAARVNSKGSLRDVHTERADRPYQYKLRRYLDCNHLGVSSYSNERTDHVMTIKVWLNLCLRHGKSG